MRLALVRLVTGGTGARSGPQSAGVHASTQGWWRRNDTASALAASVPVSGCRSAGADVSPSLPGYQLVVKG